MAIPIKSAPVLEGKAAREFYEKWSKFTDDRDKEKVKRIDRECREFFAKQKHLYVP
jgi:uncharacterized membrane protein (DUF106 family)